VARVLRVSRLSPDGRVRDEACVRFRDLVVAGGAFQTPHLLKRSGMGTLPGQKLEFHVNLKVVAEFGETIHADRGTILTVQVQEFERDGIVFMASNLDLPVVLATLAHRPNQELRRLVSRYDNLAIYAAMYRPASRARVHSCLGDQPLVTYRFDPRDVALQRKAILSLSRLLFDANAQLVYLPVGGLPPCRSMDEVQRAAESLDPRQLELVSVHAMASCSMGPDPTRHPVDLDGRLRGWSNVIIADASVLPSNIGESPQGTIMAFAHEISRRYLDRSARQC
jgi:choline dehydrogenase-like flavoprotein